LKTCHNVCPGVWAEVDWSWSGAIPFSHHRWRWAFWRGSVSLPLSREGGADTGPRCGSFGLGWARIGCLENRAIGDCDARGALPAAVGSSSPLAIGIFSPWVVGFPGFRIDVEGGFWAEAGTGPVKRDVKNAPADDKGVLIPRREWWPGIVSGGILCGSLGNSGCSKPLCWPGGKNRRRESVSQGGKQWRALVFTRGKARGANL